MSRAEAMRQRWTDPTYRQKQAEMWASDEFRQKLGNTNWAGRSAWLDDKFHHGTVMDGGLRQEFHTRLRWVHWVAVESGLTGKGIPDSNGCAQGREFWIEYKFDNHWACRLLPEQVAWHWRRYRVGGTTFIATRRTSKPGPRTPAADELWLHEGRWVRELKDGGLRGAPALGIWGGGPGCWDWEEVGSILMSRSNEVVV